MNYGLENFLKRTWETLCARRLGNDFSPKTWSMKQKAGKVDFIKIKDAYTMQDSIKKMKRQRLGEDMCKS